MLVTKEGKMHSQYNRSCWLIICLVTLSLWGCSKEAYFISENLVDDSRFRDTTLYAMTSKWANAGHTKGNSWLSERLVVANAPGPITGSTMLARSFLWFTSLPETTAKVETASLYLYVTRLDCETGPANIGLYALADTLNQVKLWWDRMPDLDADPISIFSVTEAPDSVVINVTDMVKEWVAGNRPNLGMALTSDETPGASLVLEFASRENPRKEQVSATDTTILDFRPTLRITYVDTADTSGDVRFFESVAAVDAFADTLLMEGALSRSISYLVCGNGTPSRAFVKFDLSGIPIESTVAKAVLTLSPDFENSSFDSIDLICHAVVDSPWTHFNSPIGSAGAGRVTLKRTGGAGTGIDFDITVLLQPLVAKKVENRGFVIKSVNEGADLDYVKIFGSDVAGDLLPKLEIHYVLPPSPPYRD